MAAKAGDSDGINAGFQLLLAHARRAISLSKLVKRSPNNPKDCALAIMTMSKKHRPFDDPCLGGTVLHLVRHGS